MDNLVVTKKKLIIASIVLGSCIVIFMSYTLIKKYRYLKKTQAKGSKYMLPEEEVKVFDQNEDDENHEDEDEFARVF